MQEEPAPAAKGASEPSRESRLDALTVEMLSCIERGESGRINDLLNWNPDLRADLDAFLEGQRRLISAEKKAGLGFQHEEPRSQVFPRVFGEYVLLQEIDRGGMGVVYKAQESALGRIVALKVVTSAHLASPTDLARFKLGAEAASLLHHPNVVPIYSIGWEDGQPYFTMRLIQGTNLARKLGSYLGKPREIAELIEKVARAVHHAHEHGVLHRDLKPANILIDETGQPFVTDFGLAKIMGQDDGLTLTGSLLGTRSYVAPELLSGQKDSLTTACDTYSLAVMLYELLCGQTPFKDESPAREFKRVAEEQAKFPANVLCGTDLKTICLTGLAKDPEMRYKSALELADDLRRYLERRPVRARKVSSLVRLARWTRLRPGAAFLAAVTLATLGFSAGSWILHTRETVRQNEDLLRTTTELKSREELSQRLFYAMRSRLAADALEKREVRQARKLLLDLMPAAGQIDHRGFEWGFLFRLCHMAEAWVPESLGARSAAFSPDGKIFAAGLRSGGSFFCPTGKLDDPGARTKIPHLRPNAIGTMAFENGAGELVLLQSEGTLQLWPREGESLAAKPLDLAADVAHFGLSVDGEWLGLTTSSGGVQVWSLPDRKKTAEFEGRSPRSSAVAIGPGGASLFSSETEGDMTLRLRMEGGWSQRALGASASASCACFTPDGRQLITGHKDGRLVIWDVATATPALRGLRHGREVVAAALSTDGKLLFTSGDDSTVRVWSGLTWEPLTSIRFASRPPTALAYSAALSLLVAGSSHDGLFTWSSQRLDSPQALQEPASLGVEPDSIVGIHFLDGGKQVVTVGNNLDIKRFDLVSTPFGVEAELRSHLDWPGITYRFGALSPDARWVAAGLEVSESTSNVLIWSLPEPLPARATLLGASSRLLGDHEGRISAVAFSKDSTRLGTAGTAGKEGVLKLWRLQGGPGVEVWRPDEDISVPMEAMILEFAPNGKTLAVTTWRKANPYLLLIDLETKTIRSTLDTGEDGVSSVAFSPDSSVLVTGSYTGDLDVWSLRSVWRGEIRSRSGDDAFTTHSGAVKALAFSPDGRRLASGSFGGDLKLWDISGDEGPTDLLECLSMPAQEGGVTSLRFSPNGENLVSGGFGPDRKKGEIRLWRSATRADLVRWSGSPGPDQ